MYVVFQLNKELEVLIMGREIPIPLVYAEGMIGAMPVFDSKEAAEQFAGDKYKIAKIAITEAQG